MLNQYCDFTLKFWQFCKKGWSCFVPWNLMSWLTVLLTEYDIVTVQTICSAIKWYHYPKLKTQFYSPWWFIAAQNHYAHTSDVTLKEAYIYKWTWYTERINTKQYRTVFHLWASGMQYNLIYTSITDKISQQLQDFIPTIHNMLTIE